MWVPSTSIVQHDRAVGDGLEIVTRAVTALALLYANLLLILALRRRPAAQGNQEEASSESQ